MSRKVNCIKLNKEADALIVPPMPGSKGQWVYENVSQEAWKMWQDHQTRLINEKQLSMIDPKSRKYLHDQMDRFFKGEDVDKADGYVPETK